MVCHVHALQIHFRHHSAGVVLHRVAELLTRADQQQLDKKVMISEQIDELQHTSHFFPLFFPLLFLFYLMFMGKDMNDKITMTSIFRAFFLILTFSISSLFVNRFCSIIESNTQKILQYIASTELISIFSVFYTIRRNLYAILLN